MSKKDKHIAIVSYNITSKHMNYGAALHSYAFQQILNRYDQKSIIIDYVPLQMEGYNVKYPFLNVNLIKHPRGYLINAFNWMLGLYENIRKYNHFNDFFEKYTCKTKYRYSRQTLLDLEKIEDFDFDICVCESDVIWKLYSDHKFDDIFFLNAPWAAKSRKVAYSPSIGSKPFEQRDVEKFKELTKNFYAISCREEEGANYISQVLDRNVTWVLDPTLLLDAIDYEKLAVKPKENHYLLCYNCMINDSKMLYESQKLADKLGLELIEISIFNQNKLKYRHKVKTGIDIQEWLGYFKYADFIVCNAFHGCCFATIFKKQFFLFVRDDSDYRMQSITRGLGVSERLVSVENKQIPDSFENIDYDIVYEKLAMLRKTSLNFIEKNIVNL